MALYEHYKDGPLWIGLDSCGFQELKTVLGTTEKEIQAHGFETYYECNFYDLDLLADGLVRSITYTDPHSALAAFLFRMKKDTEGMPKEFPGVRFTYSSIGRLTQLNTGRSENGDVIPHNFKFFREAGDLFQTLSDVEDVAKMVEPIKRKPDVLNLSEIYIDVTKEDFTKPFEEDIYHVRFLPDTPSWERDAPWIDPVELDIPANNMKEFLSKLQTAELRILHYLRDERPEKEKLPELEKKYGHREVRIPAKWVEQLEEEIKERSCRQEREQALALWEEEQKAKEKAPAPDRDMDVRSTSFNSEPLLRNDSDDLER